jgi:hypothetical protein
MEDEMGRAWSTHGEKRNAYRILEGKLEKEKDHYEGQDICGWIIKIDLSRMAWCGLD